MFLPSYFDLKEDEHFKKHRGYPKHNAKQGAVKHFFFLWALEKEKRLMRIPSGDSNLVQSVPAGCRWVGNFVRSSAQIEMLNSLLHLLPFCNVQAYFITSLPWQKIFLVPLFDLAWLSSTIVTVAKGSCSLPLLKVISTLEVKA